MERMNKLIPYVIALAFLAGFGAGFTYRWIQIDAFKELIKENEMLKAEKNLYQAMDSIVGCE
jgi:hypothetical protein